MKARTLAVLRFAPLALAAALLFSACHSVPAVVTHPRIRAADSVEIAADVILPVVVPDGGVPVVLIQTRYWRSFQLRGGKRNSVVPMGPREAIVEKLVTAGFGVVVTDVRGTGASGGIWPWPWSDGEVRDMGPVIDWIVAQRWSNGAVGATGASYEGTTALLTAAAGRPVLRAVLARELEWNLVDEIVAPGGVRNIGFVSSWSRSVDALDHGKLPEIFPRLARFGIRGVQPTDGDDKGAALQGLQRRRPPTDVAGSVSAVRSGSDRFGSDGPPADSLSPSGHVNALAATTAAVGMWGSWWDGATADAVLRAQQQIPVREAVIGPWAHEGTSNASPLRRGDSRSRRRGGVLPAASGRTECRSRTAHVVVRGRGRTMEDGGAVADDHAAHAAPGGRDSGEFAWHECAAFAHGGLRRIDRNEHTLDHGARASGRCP